MAITARTRAWLAVVFVVLGGALLWLGYAEDQQRDQYYDCRQSAMDALHTNLGDHLDQGPDDPSTWVPEWQEDFHDWETMLRMCKAP